MLSWLTARRTSGLSVAVVLLVGVLMPSSAQAAGTEVSAGTPGTVADPPSAVKVAKHEIPTRSAPEAAKPHVAPEPGEPAKPAADHVVADLVDTDLKPFSMFGVTWKGGLPDDGTIVEARWRSEGSWSKWTELHVDPAPGEGGLPGTEPQWVESADAADVRVLSARDAHPTDLSLTTIEASTSDGSASSSAAATSPATNEVTRAATVSKPAIILRSAWGASSTGSCDSPRYGSTTRGAVIHHTAGSNSYTKEQSAGIVRATQAYHMKGRDWCDIGYNFLVDKYGQIFEGRAGGIDKPVRAAHSGNDMVNQETMGVSMMGTFSTTEPSSAMKTAVVNLVSWRFAQYKLPATGTYSLGGKTLNRIAGHRNVVSTECPGARAYAWLSASGGLRDRVAAQLAAPSVPRSVRSVIVRPATTSANVIWTSEVGAKTYDLCLTSIPDMSTCGRTVTGLTSTSTTLSALKANSGTDYYVKVRARNAAGAGGWSSARGFDLLATPPVPRSVRSVIVRPATTSANVIWTSEVGAKTYDLCLTSIPDMSTCGRTVTGLTSTSTTLSALKANSGTDYYVKVRARNAAGAGGWSSARGFDLLTSSSNDTFSVPSSGKIPLTGHGYGHGIGMSQYGAQGAARAGVKYDKILSTYYPGTALGTRAGDIRVLISKATSSSLNIVGQSGLVFRDVAAKKTRNLPTTISGSKIVEWRILPIIANPTQSILQFRATGDFRNYSTVRWYGDGQFEGPSSMTLILPNGSKMTYRGALRSARPTSTSSSRDTVNVLPIEQYVRGVVSAEMPSSWSAEALRAQAVAARTYGVRSITSSRYYDICDTTSCQVYGGVVSETAATDAAIRATDGRILTYKSAPAFTQFSSSSGGYTAQGTQPYLKSVPDPYDGWSGNPNHQWTTTIAASTAQRAYASIGTLKQLKITKRSGAGDWGGRVSSLSLVGSKKTITITGNEARTVFGLKSNWFRF